MRRLTQDEFLARAKSIHGDKYDYSKVVYKNMKTRIIVGCPKHGDFTQSPEHHLSQKYGCPHCEMESRAGRPLYKKRSLIKGFGILDVDFSRNNDIFVATAYHTWVRMISRCNRKKYSTSDIKYKDCFVCDEWKYFSNFLKFFEENYIDGYAIDKDLIKKGNKCYCPECCCFVPQRINNLIESRTNHRGYLPIGVHQTKNGMYKAQMKKNGKTYGIGVFYTIEDAFLAYKQVKEKFIKEIAEEYYSKGLITQRVYDALLRYKVELTD